MLGNMCGANKLLEGRFYNLVSEILVNKKNVIY